jgi:hypothetical protein
MLARSDHPLAPSTLRVSPREFPLSVSAICGPLLQVLKDFDSMARELDCRDEVVSNNLV